MINIIANGSKWAGQSPDTLQDLLAMLAAHELDPIFEKYGNFVLTDRTPVVRFFGNFLTWSHVFTIDTDEPQTIKLLTSAIRKNQRTPAYRAARKELKIK